MSDAEVSMLFQLGAVVLTAVAVTGIVCTFIGGWRDEKKWKGDKG